MHTTVYELVGLTEAEAGTNVDADVDGDCTETGAARAAFFGATREALINVRKHANAQTIAISPCRRQHGLAFNVTDDGHGTFGGVESGGAYAFRSCECRGE